jgi:hypothetical protein
MPPVLPLVETELQFIHSRLVWLVVIGVPAVATELHLVPERMLPLMIGMARSSLYSRFRAVLIAAPILFAPALLRAQEPPYIGLNIDSDMLCDISTKKP